MTIEEFVKNNKFYHFNYIIKDINNLYEFSLINKNLMKGSDKDRLINMIENINNEYDNITHLYCKKIYENPNNKELIIKIGKKIYEKGGIKALTISHDIIAYFSPYKKNEIIRKEQINKIDDCFDEVSKEWIITKTQYIF